MAEAEYHHGDMNVDEQTRTFRGFVRVTVWASGLLAMVLVFLTLHFSVGINWFTALGLAFVLGVLVGLGLKMKSAWYAVIVGVAILGGVIGVLGMIVSAFTG